MLLQESFCCTCSKKKNIFWGSIGCKTCNTLLQFWFSRKEKKKAKVHKRKSRTKKGSRKKKRYKFRIACILCVLCWVICLLAWTRSETSLGRWHRLAWDYYSVLQLLNWNFANPCYLILPIQAPYISFWTGTNFFWLSQSSVHTLQGILCLL